MLYWQIFPGKSAHTRMKKQNCISACNSPTWRVPKMAGERPVRTVRGSRGRGGSWENESAVSFGCGLKQPCNLVYTHTHTHNERGKLCNFTAHGSGKCQHTHTHTLAAWVCVRVCERCTKWHLKCFVVLLWWLVTLDCAGREGREGR